MKNYCRLGAEQGYATATLDELPPHTRDFSRVRLHKNIYVTIGFGCYVVFLYVCVYFVYKCRRKIDDRILNFDLELFKTRSEEEK